MTSAVPPDFPRPATLGSVPGAQPKVLALRRGEQFVPPSDAESLEARHRVCEDLVQQLVLYGTRKRAERPDWSPEQVREKVAASVRQKAFSWGLSPAEAEWVIRRLAAGAAGASQASGPTA